MKSIPAALLAEFQAESYVMCHLVELYLSSTLRYTDCDQDIWDGGNQYFSKGLSVDKVDGFLTPALDTFSFELDNTVLEVSGFVQNQQLQGKRCIVYKAALNADTLAPIGKATHFDGFIDSVDIDHERGRFKIFNHFILWKRKSPRRTHTATCPWVFKSELCGYTGAETACDKSFDRCTELENTDWFGGFATLPAIENKKIPWGRVVAL
ncbi:MAG: hypothetical protein V3U75_12905 [Methylococcaceae bacterium]